MGPNQARKARVIAKIKGSTDLELEASGKWISVHRPEGDDSGTTKVSFGDESTSRKESYELDYCYDQSEGNDLIFSREVKPLVEGVFSGCNGTVIAYGAIGSGKTFTIQGSEGKPGLAVLAMAEILSMAEESGKLISISCYEISKDHAYDLLDPNRHEVLIWEDVARGKVQLKGLSQASYNLCYEDGRRKSTGGVNLLENNIINKSIYALHNVVYALNANDSHVPYRESKLTRMLRDSLGGTNKILMITCLNSSYCQDSLCMVKLASRSCKCANRTIPDSAKKTKSMVRPTVLSSSSKSASATATKQIGTRVGFSGNKANAKASTIKGRKLFDEACHSAKSKKSTQKESLPLEIISTVTEHAKQEEEKQSSGISQEVESLTEDHYPLQAFSSEESDMSFKASTQETKLLDENNHDKATPNIDGNAESLSFVEADPTIDKENNLVLVNNDESPPISVRLQELSKSLKLLCSSTPSCVEILSKTDISIDDQVPTETLEPKTPKTPEPRSLVNDESETVDNSCASWKTFSAHSLKMKDSLVNEYLGFLNTASK
ncbi:hypothetical protein V6N12_058142 [Hibiscus sabdariffa]